MKRSKCLWFNFCDCFVFIFNFQFERIDSEKVWVMLGLRAKLSPLPPGAVTIFYEDWQQKIWIPHPTSYMPTKYIPTHTHASAPSIIHFRQHSSRSFSAQKIRPPLSFSLSLNVPLPHLVGKCKRLVPYGVGSKKKRKSEGSWSSKSLQGFHRNGIINKFLFEGTMWQLYLQRSVCEFKNTHTAFAETFDLS